LKVTVAFLLNGEGGAVAQTIAGNPNGNSGSSCDSSRNSEIEKLIPAATKKRAGSQIDLGPHE
jgi:hypothetical protein